MFHKLFRIVVISLLSLLTIMINCWNFYINIGKDDINNIVDITMTIAVIIIYICYLYDPSKHEIWAINSFFCLRLALFLSAKYDLVYYLEILLWIPGVMSLAYYIIKSFENR